MHVIPLKEQQIGTVSCQRCAVSWIMPCHSTTPLAAFSARAASILYLFLGINSSWEDQRGQVQDGRRDSETLWPGSALCFVPLSGVNGFNAYSVERKEDRSFSTHSVSEKLGCSLRCQRREAVCHFPSSPWAGDREMDDICSLAALLPQRTQTQQPTHTHSHSHYSLDLILSE